jgi:ketosteroid isomerase-like protein
MSSIHYTATDRNNSLNAQAWFSSFDGPIGFEVRNLVIVAGADTAFSHSLNRYSGAKLNGERIDMWVRMTTGYRRIEGRWAITHEHSSVPFDTESGRASLDLKP